jgi:hypothetical protein
MASCTCLTGISFFFFLVSASASMTNILHFYAQPHLISKHVHMYTYYQWEFNSFCSNKNFTCDFICTWGGLWQACVKDLGFRQDMMQIFHLASVNVRITRLPLFQGWPLISRSLPHGCPHIRLLVDSPLPRWDKAREVKKTMETLHAVYYNSHLWPH